MDPVLQILNNVVQKNLPILNQEIVNGIQQNNLDPMAQVVNGTHNLGRIDLGIGHASADADYNVVMLTGLSSLNIQDLTIVSGGSTPNDPSQLSGSIVMHAAMGRNLTAHAGGGISASLGFIHKHVGISGTVTVQGATAAATGTFNAAIEDSKICLTRASLTALSVNYQSVDVNIDGLGFFNSLLGPLKSVILDATKGALRGAVATALRPVINDQIGKALPVCGPLS